MICDKIVCINEIPKEEYKLFFGDTGHITRSDKVTYPAFQKLYEKAFADFWTWKVVNFKQDAVGWEKLEEKAKRAFLLNLAYQTTMDSGVYSEYFYFLKFVSNSELAILYSMIGLEEVIHAASYSYGLAQMFGANTDDKFNIIYNDPFIKHRLDAEIDFSSEVMRLEKYKDEEKLKLPLLKSIVATLFLEKVKFPNSFYVTWSINDYYDFAIQGFSQLLKEIAFDELTTHVPTNIQVLNILMSEKRQGFIHLKDELVEFIYSYVKQGIKKEDEWIDYLLSEGEFGNLTKESMKYFVRYQADDMLRQLKLKPIYNVKHSNLITWFKGYYNINNQNNANQELSNISYRKGVVKNDLYLLDKLKGE